jgi:hypothetical protein
MRWAARLFLSLPVGLSCAVCALVIAQEPPKQGVSIRAEAPKAPPGGSRKLAPGVIVTIPPERQNAETASSHDLIRLLEKSPEFGQRENPSKPGEIAIKNLARSVRLTHKIWALEFNFKPMRMIEVDVPRPGEKFDRKNIWYMIYYVRYLPLPPKGKAKEGEEVKQPEAEPANAEGEEAEGAKLPKEVKFVPRFVLISNQKVKLADGREVPKVYTDRLIPVALDPIRLREDPQLKLLNSVEIAEKPIPLTTPTEEHAVWGVATWEDIDPKTDWFSVYIQGLTNAYKIEPVAGKDAEGNETKRWRYLRKTLVLNYWRPGDEFFESDREFRLGQPNNVEYSWEYK